MGSSNDREPLRVLGVRQPHVSFWNMRVVAYIALHRRDTTRQYSLCYDVMSEIKMRSRNTKHVRVNHARNSYVDHIQPVTQCLRPKEEMSP